MSYAKTIVPNLKGFDSRGRCLPLGAQPCHIDTLPLELLAAIFEAFIGNLRDVEDSYYRVLYALIGVSKRWQDTIKRTPQLWVLVNSRDPAHVWMDALERSRSCPLDVALLPPHDEDVCQDNTLLYAVSRHIDRWRRANLQLSFVHDISALETHAAPHLTRLDLLVGEGTSYKYPYGVELFQGCAPKLRSVSLQGVALKSWRSPILFGLRQLSLYWVPYNRGPSLVEVMDILDGSPQLESLRLDLLHLGDQYFPPYRSPITLPRLAILRFGEEETEFVLGSLRLPRCAQYILDWAPTRTPDLANAASSLASSLITAQGLDITFGPRSTGATTLAVRTTQSCPHDRQFFLELPTYAIHHAMFASGVLQVIENAMSGAVPIALTIGWFGDLLEGDVEDILRRLRGVESIHLSEARDTELGAIIALLSAPRSAGGVQSWLCPNLRSLTVSDTITDGEEATLVRLAEARLEAFKSKELMEEREVVRLEELVLNGRHPPTEDGWSHMWVQVDGNRDSSDYPKYALRMLYDFSY